jgi:HD-GYP domain-containing protein (c-di-GMP phosphodiesterase class II)/DNA-binding CsgD family transcriptional regulator
LGELIAALSLAFDIGNNYPPEKALRNTLLATSLGQEIGLRGQALSDVYYVSQLRYLGCTAYSHELAKFLGVDELASRNAFAGVSSSDALDVLKTTLTRVGRTAGPVKRVRAVANLAVRGRHVLDTGWKADCEAANRLASRLQMSSGVCSAVVDVYSSWDGKGAIGRWAKGDAIALPARIAHLAHVAEIHHRLAGQLGAVKVVKERAGSDFDPEIAAVFVTSASRILEPLEQSSVWDALLALEPEPRPWIPRSQLDKVAQAFGDFADLKSPFTLGHSNGVARLAAGAAQQLGMDPDQVASVRRAAWLHDLGRVSVPNTIWDKSGPLTPSDWERVRLHPYYTERILARSTELQPLASDAGMHHERLDGSGYYRAAHASSISRPARILAVADVFHALTEERPNRPALSAELASRTVIAEAQSGRLDRDAVRAVVEVAGGSSRRPRLPWPGGLSDREVDVLRLVARGKPNAVVAALLHISENTVHHHVKRIYDKIEVSTRAGAALFAMEHDLLER